MAADDDDDGGMNETHNCSCDASRRSTGTRLLDSDEHLIVLPVLKVKLSKLLQKIRAVNFTGYG